MFKITIEEDKFPSFLPDQTLESEQPVLPQHPPFGHREVQINGFPLSRFIKERIMGPKKRKSLQGSIFNT